MRHLNTIIIILLLLSCLSTMAQNDSRGKKIRYKASTLTVDKRDGEKYQKLIDNVVFTQKNTTVYCDSSFYFKKTNIMEAYGHVRIVDDSVVITSKELLYDGNSRLSNLRKNVVYTKADRRMYTDFLDYNIDTEIAHYFNGGKLLDSTNTLTSETGYFYSLDNYALFYHNVVLVSPNFTLSTDTLKYDTNTKIAYSNGPTLIENADGTTLFSEGGVFRTVVDQSDFVDGKVLTENYELEGDELFFDEIQNYYKSIGHVVLTAKTKDLIIIGEEGFYDKENGYSKIYGNPVMKRILEADTFYIAADTLVAIENSIDSLERILAYSNIRIFKAGLQGLSDSAAYFLSDSLIYMYSDPIIWNNKNQITADTISLEVTESSIDKMNLYRNSFLAAKDTIENFNQIKGRNMVAFFLNNQIDYITVDGNAEGIYYALAEGDSSIMGMNKFICSTMKIGFTDQQLTNISIYTNPEAQFIPPKDLTPELTRLPGYTWRESERPTLIDIFSAPKKAGKYLETGELPVNGKLYQEVKQSILEEKRPEGLIKNVKSEDKQ